MAAAASTAAPVRRCTRASAGAASRPTAASTVATATSGRSHGSHVGVRSSSTTAQAPVAATATAASARPASVWRCDHSWCAPIATSAPMAGASATV